MLLARAIANPTGIFRKNSMKSRQTMPSIPVAAGSISGT